MRSVNKVILVGNLTRDPEKKETASGQSIVTFGLATNREWVTRSGEKHSLAEYTNIAVWGNLADICHQYLRKGRLVYIEGYLKTRSWDTPEGVKMHRTEVVATDMIMLQKREDAGDPMDTPANSAPAPAMGNDDPGMPSDDEMGNMFDPGDSATEEKPSDAPAEAA